MWLLAGGAVAGAWASPAEGDPARGERVFQRCFAYHSVVAGEDKLPGPTLRGVLDRRAGTQPGFRFSPAMIAAGARGSCGRGPRWAPTSPIRSDSSRAPTWRCPDCARPLTAET